MDGTKGIAKTGKKGNKINLHNAHIIVQIT